MTAGTPTPSSSSPRHRSSKNTGSSSPLRRTLRQHFTFPHTFSPSNNNGQQQRRQRAGSGSSFGSRQRRLMTTMMTTRYFSRRHENNVGDSHHLLLLNPGDHEKFVGMYSPVGVFWGLVFLTVPLAYLYIAFVLLRELCGTFPLVFVSIDHYAPWLGTTITKMHHVSRWVEFWCCLEVIFYIGLKLHIRYLQTRDPLEASLSAAPMMEPPDRAVLWDRIMECEKADPVTFLRGWFFDEPLENISKYDIRDFIAWCMFEGRHQEHLTEAELRQLERFVGEMEHRISLHLYGEVSMDDADADGVPDADPLDPDTIDFDCPIFEKKPKKKFQFSEGFDAEESNYFSELYELYRKAYEQNMNAMRSATADFGPVQSLTSMVNDATADFHPVQDFRNLMAETGRTIGKAEESAMATATHMYETLVPAGSQMDKQISAMSHATYTQMTEAWNSVKNMKERLETARFLKRQRRRVRQQLKGYRELLKQMRDMSSAVPSKQMAGMMRRITECNEQLEKLENRAQTAFAQATGFAMQTMPFLPERRKPQRFAKYSSDPLLGIATYPLGFHLLVFALTEIPLRILMSKRGFERRVMGPVAYYFHPGINSADDNSVHSGEGKSEDDDEEEKENTPIVFVHGIGLGLLPYISLIDALLETGRPVLLPEIPYVSGFRPFQSPNGVLPPAVVSSTMTAMLASHGFLKATWMGHSYGTSWLSYMCKYAPKTVAALQFLDPICFCLHVPYLTKQFVYLKPDPGTVSYMVRTDVIINWTIQRSFPWTWVTLFAEQIKVPCAIFLSEQDALVPAKKVETYLENLGIPIQDIDNCTAEYFYSGKNEKQEEPERGAAVDRDNNDEVPVLAKDSTKNDSDVNSVSDSQSRAAPRIVCAVFRGHGHGDWTEQTAATVPIIVDATKALCRRAEEPVS